MQIRKRLPYLLLIILIIPIGLASRKFDAELPYLYGKYAPDVLWATVIYLGLRFLIPNRPLVISVIGALTFSYLIEVSQFYNAPWIDSIRATWLGGLILGFSFLWSDLFCYALGIFLGYAVDRWWIQKRSSTFQPKPDILGLKK